MEQYLQTISALNDPFRLTILAFLRRYGRSCVCEMQHALDVKQARLSTALKILVQAGLLKVQREGRWAYYAIDAPLEYQRELIAQVESLNIELPAKTPACDL
jgi:ArsR family transcriptional regulator